MIFVTFDNGKQGRKWSKNMAKMKSHVILENPFVGTFNIIERKMEFISLVFYKDQNVY